MKNIIDLLKKQINKELSSEELNYLLTDTSIPFHQDLTRISYEISDLNRSIRNGVMGHDDRKKEQAKIKSALLRIIDELSREEFLLKQELSQESPKPKTTQIKLGFNLTSHSPFMLPEKITVPIYTIVEWVISDIKQFSILLYENREISYGVFTVYFEKKSPFECIPSSNSIL
jgi:hypothetical protein